MSPRAINEIVHGKRSISANSALRIAKFFGTSPEFWLNPQTSFDLENALKDIDLKAIRRFNELFELIQYNHAPLCRKRGACGRFRG